MQGKVLAALDAISDWSGKIVSFIMVPLIAVICYDVFMRYVLNKPTDWVNELSGFLFGTIWLIGGAYALRHGAHVKMEVFYDRWPKRVRAIADVLTAPFFFLLVGVLLWQGYQQAVVSWAQLEHSWSMWSPPIYWAKTIIPVGALLILLQGISKFARDIIVIVNGGNQ